ncbi:MAG: tRNA lysidine(34) synthetase TilS [Luteimonas sp.]
MAPHPTTLQLPPLPADAGVGALHVGYSGGLDSSVLLHLLCTAPAWRGRVQAVHVHHGLHADADAWAAHCRRVCDAMEVPLRMVRVEVHRGADVGLEAAARAARHEAFSSVMATGDVLALAHHRDDQGETFLLRGLRASGVDGLGAMRPWRAFGAGWLWRPLLALPRERLLAHAREHGLAWIEDAGNHDLAQDRNFLRHRVLPLLRERWPGCAGALARSAALSAEAADLLSAEDAAALSAVRGEQPRTLVIERLKSLPASRRARVLRLWVADCGLPPLTTSGVDTIETSLLDARPDAEAEFAWQGTILRSWRGRLHVEARRTPLPQAWRAAWDGCAPLALPSGGELRLQGIEAFDAPVSVHARTGGERIRLPGRSHSHALKHVLQDLGVPPWIREHMPLLSDAEGSLLAAGDAAYSETFDTWLRANHALLVWDP